MRTSGRAPRAALLLASAAALIVSGGPALPAAHAALAAEARGPALALLEQLAPSDGERPHVVILNGQRLLFISRTTESPVSAVLDAFELGCDTGEPAASAATSDTSSAPRGTRGATELAPGARPERWLTARHADADGSVGQGACFADTDARSNARSLGARLWAFVRSGDLSSLGQARYVLARRPPGGVGTHVLEVRAPGTFSLRALLDGPEPQPAADPVPAPVDVEPLLDARVEGQPHAVRLYTSPEPPPAVLDRYTRQLLASGFELSPSPDDAVSSRALLGPELATLLTVSRVGEQTLLTRVEIARPRHAEPSPEAP